MSAVDALDQTRDLALFDGVRTRRMMAFLLDVTVVALLNLLVYLLVGLLGIVTFTLGWSLYALPLGALVAIAYTGSTLGGSAAATPGMQLAGLQMRTLDGERPGFLLAVLHGVLFWFLVTMLTPLVLIVGLLNERKRLLHDILVGTIVVRASRLGARTV